MPPILQAVSKDCLRAASAGAERSFRVAVLLAVEELVVGFVLGLRLGALAGLPGRVLLGVLLRVRDRTIGLRRVARAAQLLVAAARAAVAGRRGAVLVALLGVAILL